MDADYDQEIDDRDNCVLRDDIPLDGDHDSAMTSIGWGTDEDYDCFDNDW